jgi:hypothetical protein
MSHAEGFWLAKKGAAVVEGPYDGITVLEQIREGRIRVHDQINESRDERFWFDAGLLVAFPRATRRYHDWLWCLRFNTTNVGPRCAALLAATLPVTFISVLLGLQFFPPGQYLKIMLAAPGILVGLVFLYSFGFVLFKLPTSLAITLSACVTIAGALGLIWLLRLMAG